MNENNEKLTTHDSFEWCSSICTKSTNKDNETLVGVKKRAYQRKLILIKNENLILKRLEELDPIAANGTEKHLVSPTLIDELLNYAKSLESSANNIINAINFVRKIAILGNDKLGWNSPVPQPAIRLRNYRNPLTVEKFGYLEKISKEINSFENYLLDSDFEFIDSGEELSNEDIALIWGITIYSLSAYSACLDNKCLIRLMEGGWRILRHKYVWIDVYATSDPNSRLYRVFPDPISIYFLQIIYKHKLFKPFEKSNEGWAWLNKAVQKLRRLLTDSFGGSVHEWRTSIETWHQIHLPSQLVELAKGHPKTTAMEPYAWQRTILQKPIYKENITPLNKDFKAEFFSYASVSSKKNVKFLSTNETYTRLLLILGSKFDTTFTLTEEEKKKGKKTKRVNLLKELLEEVNQLPSFSHAVVSWLLYKLTKATSRIEVSSANTYLTNFFKDLMTILAEEDPALIDDEAYESVYTEIINSAKSDSLKTMRMQLIVQFHRYLMMNFGATSINFDNLPEFNGDIGAKAYFVTVDEFAKAKTLIKNNPSNRYKIAYLIMVLCYRCGLRIGEAINLMLNDIHFPSMDLLFTDCAMTITIRPKVHHKLKTVNANRQLPLHLLLEPSELLEFKHFVAEQHKVKNIETDQLFHSNLNLNSPIEKNEICKVIVATLRDVTQDHEITVHQLRHSFCCLLFQLVFTDLEVTPLPNHWVKGNQPVDINLRDLLLRHTAQSRRPVYQIAEWMGHSSPSMSLSAYMHWGHLPVRQKLDALFKDTPQTNAKIKKIMCKLLCITDDNLKIKLHKKDQNLNDTVASVIKVPRLNKTQNYIKKSKIKFKSNNILLSDFSLKHWITYFQVISKLQDIEKTESYLGIEPGQTQKAIEVLKVFSDQSKRYADYRLFPKLSKEDINNSESSALFKNLGVIIPPQLKQKEISIAEEIYVCLEKAIKQNLDFIVSALGILLKRYKHYQKAFIIDEAEEIDLVTRLGKKLEKTSVSISINKFCISPNSTSIDPVEVLFKSQDNNLRPYGFIHPVILLSLKYNDLFLK